MFFTESDQVCIRLSAAIVWPLIVKWHGVILSILYWSGLRISNDFYTSTGSANEKVRGDV
jgi:hypothetical protein